MDAMNSSFCLINTTNFFLTLGCWLVPRN